ncbi:MAG: C10 family peptidase [Bacteroidales bacterium]|nr:C10 family peptidase [Bacteroidales bacterium]
MKRSVLLSLMAMLGATLSAQQRDATERMSLAREVLEGSAQSRSVTDERCIDPLVELCRPNDQVYVYGYSNGAPGWVMISAQEGSHPILGYSKEDHWNVQRMPEGVLKLMNVYAERSSKGELSTEILQQNEVESRTTATEVAPLLGGIKFDQWEPYNEKCPMHAGRNSVVGCVGTALSEIMAYHKHPLKMDNTLGNISYKTQTERLTASWNVENTTFDWNNIIDTYVKPASVVPLQMKVNAKNDFTHAGFELSSQDDCYIVIKELVNISGNNFTGDVQLFLLDSNDQIKAAASLPSSVSNLPSTAYYPEYCFEPNVSSSLEDGTYRLYAFTANDKEESWSAVAKTEGKAYIEVEKKGNVVNILGKDFTCSYTPLQSKAIANLCGAAAHAAMSDFTYSATAASNYDGGKALVNYMGYSDRMQMMQPEHFGSNEWHNYLQTEIVNERPIIVCGTGRINTVDFVGHAFVIDGYETQANVPYYHVNWGWNGMSNGHFLIDYLVPDVTGAGGAKVNYGEDMSVIGNIHPNTVKDEASNQMGTSSMTLTKSSIGVKETLKVSLKNFGNCSFKDMKNSEVFAFAINASGKEYNMGKIFTVEKLQIGYRWSGIEIPITIPATVPTGDYTIELRTLDPGCTLMTRVQAPSLPKLHITNTTAIEELEAESSNPQLLYDLNGRVVNESYKGVAVGKDTKRLMK